MILTIHCVPIAPAQSMTPPALLLLLLLPSCSSLGFLHSPRNHDTLLPNPTGTGSPGAARNPSRKFCRIQKQLRRLAPLASGCCEGEQWCSIRLTAQADNVTRSVQSRSGSHGMDASCSGRQPPAVRCRRGAMEVPDSWRHLSVKPKIRLAPSGASFFIMWV